VADVAALLLNWQQPQLTEQCLSDLADAGLGDAIVIVIDNGSRDDSVSRLRAAIQRAAARGLRAELLELSENTGFTGGMNAGFARARELDCEFSLVLNNDLRLGRGFLQPLMDAMRADPRIGAITPTVVYPDGLVWAQGGRLAFGPNALQLCGHGERPAPIDEGPKAIDFAPGACVLFRTEDVVALGGFDDRYFMYWEDVELSRRLCKQGKRIVWLPWVRVTHLGGASAGGGRSQLRKFLMAKNSVRYLREHGTWQMWASVLLIDVLTLPFLLVLRTKSFAAKARGLLAGFRGEASTAQDVARWRSASN
jgi:N-acetylglucosaminyl-diphospho-decaprenol L-rhamnosyltransferase